MSRLFAEFAVNLCIQVNEVEKICFNCLLLTEFLEYLCNNVLPASYLLFFHLLLKYCLCTDTPKELTEEEKLQVLHSEEFLSFFERGSRIVERALSEQVDVCFDYSGRDLEDKEG